MQRLHTHWMLMKLVHMLFCYCVLRLNPLDRRLPPQHSCLLSEMQMPDISSADLLLCILMRGSEFQLCTSWEIRRQDTLSKNIHDILLMAALERNVFTCILTLPAVLWTYFCSQWQASKIIERVHLVVLPTDWVFLPIFSPIPLMTFQ